MRGIKKETPNKKKEKIGALIKFAVMFLFTDLGPFPS